MKKLVLVGALVVIGLVVIGGAFLVTQIPSVAEQLPADAMPLLVTLTLPANESTVPLDQLTTITGEAIGSRPIVALELWVNGVLAQKTIAPQGAKLTLFPAFWTWTPSSPGEHTLLVRARDADDNIVQSNVVRVIAAKAEPRAMQAGYVPEPGESVPAVAVKFKTSPQAILDLNPQIHPTNPLPPTQPINVPIPVPTITPPDAESTAPLPPPPDPQVGAPTDVAAPAPGSPSPWWFWIKGLIKADKVPTAPSLWAKGENCSVRLTVKDNSTGEDGFFVYRSKPTAVSFERIATLDAHSASDPFNYIDSDIIGGQWLYYISAFNTKGESPSGIVAVDASGPVECMKLMEPTLALNQGKLTFKEKIDKAYCYVAINDGKWTRVPPTPGAFIFPDKDGAFDVSPWINQLPPGDVKLAIECWGWQGDTLVHLGKTEQVFKKAQTGPVAMEVEKLVFKGDLQNIPISKPLKAGDQKLWLAPPVNLTLTGNAKVCADHMPGALAIFGGAITCQEAIKSSYAVLVWNWKTAFCPLGAGCVNAGKPDGYRVYREGYPVASLFKEVKGDQLTVAMFPFPAPPWAPPVNGTLIQKIMYELDKSRCYTVRAYQNTVQGMIESEDSTKLCLGDVQMSKVTTLKPADSLTRFRRKYEDCPEAYTPNVLKNLKGPVAAGFEHGAATCDMWNVYLRGAVWFDLSQAPTPITHAALYYKLVGSLENYTPPFGSEKSCAHELMLGTEDWRGDPYGDKPISIPGQDYTYIGYHEPVMPGHLFSVDVTNPVQEWLTGTRPNYGFVLRGFDEVLEWHDDLKDCASVYDSFELKIQHYGQ